MRRVEVKCEATGDIQAAYDKADAPGKHFIESHDNNMKNDVLGRVRFRKGTGSGMMRCRPDLRGVFRNGRMVWSRL